MKLAHIFTIVLGLHAVVITAMFVGPGCASETGHTNAAAAEPVGEPGHVQEQPYRPAGGPSRPNAVASQSGGQTRYPPTRPDWNISDSAQPKVIVAEERITEAYVADPLPSGPIEDSSVAGFNTVRPTKTTVLAPPASTYSSRSTSAGKTYIVKKGDVLSKIARENGASLSDVMAVNGFTRASANQLKIGQAIIIPTDSDGEVSVPVVSQGPQYSSAIIDEEGTQYTVKSGDNLSGIASRNHTTVRAIISANGLASDRIYVGQSLLIPQGEPEVAPVVGVPNADGEVTYIVASGDTLGGISKRYSVPVKDIMVANGISDPRRLRVGQVLSIPTGLEPVGPPAPKPTIKITPPVSGNNTNPPLLIQPSVPFTEEVVEIDEFDIENAPVVQSPAN
ncbi:LysM peptidoglycan-binding domain-containing protein [Cerasicoccus arenae]|nr:LysM peptidoglycan-binding domain-containing protein [Cerasicoccus arenae]MBK1856855.1 LysM peptidoglycan-binding domain-containing protein [Cerasicoccus arenae]